MSAILQIYCCDDVPEMRQRYADLVNELAKKNAIPVNVKLFNNGEQLLFALEDAPNEVDILYLDVYMGKLSGIETGKQLRALGCHAEIIFLTTSEEDVFESFDVNPLYYILKNRTNNEKFEDIFLKAVQLCRGKEQAYFVCESARVKKLIPLNSIYFFEVQNRIVTVHFGNNETFEFYSTIEKLESELDPARFVRCHRAYIVQLRTIAQIGAGEMQLGNGLRVPVGATYSKELKSVFSDYLTEH